MTEVKPWAGPSRPFEARADFSGGNAECLADLDYNRFGSTGTFRNNFNSANCLGTVRSDCPAA